MIESWQVDMEQRRWLEPSNKKHVQSDVRCKLTNLRRSVFCVSSSCTMKNNRTKTCHHCRPATEWLSRQAMPFAVDMDLDSGRCRVPAPIKAQEDHHEKEKNMYPNFWASVFCLETCMLGMLAGQEVSTKLASRLDPQ